MWPFGKKTARRQEIRRSKAERRAPLLQRLDQVIPLPLFGLAIVAAFIAALTVGVGGELQPYRVDQKLDRPLPARVPFEIYEASATSKLRSDAYSHSPNYYRLNARLLEDIRGKFSSTFTIAGQTPDDPEKIRDEARTQSIILDDDGLAELQRIVADEALRPTFTRNLEDAIKEMPRHALVGGLDAPTQRSPSRAILITSEDGTETIEKKITEVLVLNAESIAQIADSFKRKFPLKLRDSVKKSILTILTNDGNPIPIYQFDPKLTTERAEKARADVEPVTTPFQPPQIIVNAGIITDADLVKIEHEHAEYRKVQRENAGLLGFIGIAGPAGLGRAILVFLATISVATHFLVFRDTRKLRIFRQVVMAAVLLGLLLITRLSAFAMSTAPAYFALAPQVIGAALMVIVYQKTKIVVPLILTTAFALTLAVQQDASFFFVLFGSAAVMAAALKDIRRRGQVILVGLSAAIFAAIATVGANFVNQQPWPFMIANASWAACSTLAAAFIVEGILPLVERAFKLSTSLTLLEWCDASKPLQRMMAAESPGTYNHSLLVGTLAEAAAEAIGANGLLCRAGACYHDIGKINKPEYFVENQALRANMHDRLSPAMSLLIIIGHVKDGIEMAKEYGLPESLHPFIPEHHGTTLIEYFYHAASKNRGPNDPAIPDTEFRYPGPKPQSKETAIMMLCDAVEGAVRAMSEPTPSRIEDTVGKMAEKRLMDGQFDECELTFRELATIRASLVKSLCAIYHSRIKYPTEEEKAATKNVGA